MLEITSICKRFGKRASHFTDNRKLDTTGVVARGGIGGSTQIPDHLVADFLWWLSPQTRNEMVNNGVPAALELARSWKQ